MSFENYIKDNRQHFRKKAETDTDVWSKIENKLYFRRQQRLRRYTGIAATLALLLAFSAFLKVHLESKNEASSLPLYSYSQEYGVIEIEYAKAVSYKIDILNNTNVSTESIEDLESYITGLQVLDDVYEGYKKIIDIEGCDQIMMELIIDNYKRKIELLESLQDEITKIKSYENNYESEQSKLSL